MADDPGPLLRRRDLLARGVGALAGAAALSSCAGGGGGTQSPPGPPVWRSGNHRGVFWGVQTSLAHDPAYLGEVAALERKLGRRFAAVRQNYWPNPGQPAVSRQIDAAYAAGRRWTYVNGKPRPLPQDGGGLRWSSVAGGLYDAELTDFLGQIRDDGRWSPANPFHFSFNHEQEVIDRGSGRRAGTPAEFRDAFVHVRALMDATGAHVSAGGNMLLAWTPDWRQIAEDGNAGWGGYPYDATNCDPATGRADVPYDLLGCDIYRRRHESATAMWTPVQRWARKRGVAFFAGEAGIPVSAGSAADVVAYLRELDGLLHRFGAGDAPGQCVAICWTSRITARGDDRLDADPAVLAQYRRMAHELLFSASAA